MVLIILAAIFALLSLGMAVLFAIFAITQSSLPYYIVTVVFILLFIQAVHTVITEFDGYRYKKLHKEELEEDLRRMEEKRKKAAARAAAKAEAKSGAKPAAATETKTAEKSPEKN